MSSSLDHFGSEASQPGLFNVKGVSRWAKSSGNVNYTVAEIAEYDFHSRFSSIDREVAYHRRHMTHTQDAVCIPGVFSFIDLKAKQSLNMKVPSGKVVSASHLVMWVHMPNSTQCDKYGDGICLRNSGVQCKLSAALNGAASPVVFDMVYFAKEMNTSFVLNEDNAIALVSDIMEEEGKPVLVVDAIKKVTESKSPIVDAHMKAWHEAILIDGPEPLLAPEELTEKSLAKRASVAFEVPESPAVNKKRKGEAAP